MRRSLVLSLSLAAAVAALSPRAVAGPEAASAVAFEDPSTSFEALLAKAKAAGKPAFLDFWSPT